MVYLLTVAYANKPEEAPIGQRWIASESQWESTFKQTSGDVTKSPLTQTGLSSLQPVWMWKFGRPDSRQGKTRPIPSEPSTTQPLKPDQIKTPGLLKVAELLENRTT